MEQELYTIGRIGKAHGIKGELRLEFDVHQPDAYLGIEFVYVATSRGKKGYPVLGLRPAQGFYILCLQGVETRSQAELLQGCDVYYPDKLRPAEDVPDDADEARESLVGTIAVDVQGKPIGTILDIETRTMQDLLVLDVEGTEVLVPVAPAIVLGPHPESGLLQLALPEGLLELYTNPGAAPDLD